MSAQVPEAASAEKKAEEAKLKARYPHLGQKPGRKDYRKGKNMLILAKAKMKNKQLPTAAPNKTEVTGDLIPTPQGLPQRKPSLVASKLAG
uniref:cAMP-regulated phosphoprotein 19 n=1 Tax=Microcebus murinus TaxID=30608 RepID=A0A8C5Y2S5_MICMU